MKKILVLMLLAASIFLTVSSTYAYDYETQTEINITNDLDFTISASNGYYYMQTERQLIDFESISIELATAIGSQENAIVPQASIYHSRMVIYNDATTSTAAEYYELDYEAQEATEIMFIHSEEAIGSLDTSLFTGKYFLINIMLNPDINVSLLEYELTQGDTLDFDFRAVYNIQTDTAIDDLPLTAGSPFTDGNTGTVTDFVYNEESNNISATINYLGAYEIQLNDMAFSDAAFLDKVSTIDYYTADNEKFLQFNFIDNENVLLNDNPSAVNKWNGFALWNLTTNELVVYNKALALTYLDITDEREIYAYLYLANIPVDEVIAVSGNFNYRYGYTNFFGVQKYYEWQTALFALEKDSESYGSQSFFNGTLPQWSYDAAAYSLAALAAGSILSAIPPLQLIGVPLLFTSAALMASSVATAIEHVAYGAIDEIVEITPTTELRNTLNMHYTEAAGALTVLPTTAKVQKLFLGLFTQAGTNVVEPDVDTFVYTEITWLTNGQVYELDKNYINTEAVLDFEDAAAIPEEDTGGWLEDLGEYGTYITIALVIIAAGYLLTSADKAVTSLAKITRDKRKLAIFIVLIFVVLYLLGIIII